MLHFSTDINLSHLSPKEQELAKKRISIIIEIKGGLNGSKLFHFKPEELVFSEEGETISFNKIIILE
jgi:CheY-specific phosphatase CheX